MFFHFKIVSEMSNRIFERRNFTRAALLDLAVISSP